MIDKLTAELVKAQDNLSDISFSINGEDFLFYFRYLTLLEKVRVEQSSIKMIQTINADGSTTERYEMQDHLIPIHTIIEKSLDVNGKRVFSHTNPSHFKLISDFPAGIASRIAYEMSLDIFGSMKKEDK